MGRITESVATINSTIRTLLALVVVAGLAAGSWFAYTFLHANEAEAKRASEALAAVKSELEQKNALIQRKDVEINSLGQQVKDQQVQIDKLDTSLRLLKVNHRVARLTVVDQKTEPATGQIVSVIQFQELNEQNQPVSEPRQFTVQGDMVYVDSWVVKFEDKYIEKAEIDRASSLVLFRRIFGEYQEPKDGFALDVNGSRPEVYSRGGKMSDLERKIWDDFWSVASDESRQAELGIRAAHGDAPSIRVKKGKIYRVELRASDGLTIKPEGDIEAPKPPAA